MSVASNTIASINNAIKNAVNQIEDVNDFYTWQKEYIFNNKGKLEYTIKEINGVKTVQIRNTKSNRQRANTTKALKNKINPRTLKRKTKKINEERLYKNNIDMMIQNLYADWREGTLDESLYYEITNYFESHESIPSNVINSTWNIYKEDNNYYKITGFDNKGDYVDF